MLPRLAFAYQGQDLPMGTSVGRNRGLVKPRSHVVPSRLRLLLTSFRVCMPITVPIGIKSIAISMEYLSRKVRDNGPNL